MREGVNPAVLGEAERQLLSDHGLVERAIHALSPLAILDATQTGIPVVFVNAAFEALTGYSHDEAHGQTVGWLTGHATDQEMLDRVHSSLTEGHPIQETAEMYRKDGTSFWMDIAGSPLYADDGTLLRWICFLRDVTARENAYARLRVAEERYRRLTENLPEVIPYVVEVTPEGEWSIVYVAPQIEGLLGYPAEHWTGANENWKAAVHPDDRERTTEIAKQRFAGTDGTDVEYRLLRPDGSFAWVWDRGTVQTFPDGRIARHEGVLVDVTRAKRAEAELARAEERQRSVIERLQEGVLLADSSGQVLMANSSVSRILGADMSGQDDVFEFGRNLDAWWEEGTPLTDKANCKARRTLESGEKLIDQLLRVRQQDGSDRWISVNYLPLGSVGGRPSMLVISLDDITEQRHITDELRRREHELRSIVSSAPIILSSFDLDGNYTLVEGRGIESIGIAPEGVIGKNLFELYADQPQVTEAARRALDGESFTTAIEFGGFVFETHGSPIIDRDGKVIGALSVATDVTERRRAEERLSHMAMHDALTGLPNRSLFLDRLDHALRRCRREGSRCAVLFIDLDRFKRINDSLGHRAGDQILLQTADRITSVLRADDSVSRLGGDEFTVLCEGILDERETLRIAGKIADEISHLYDLEDGELYVTASIGVALSESTSTPDELLRDADAAMYRAKSGGRARTELFDDESRSHNVNRLALESALHGALERGEFCLHYQPKVSLRSGRVAGYEALLRWEHPDRGLLAPDEFIEVAEDSGLIVPIGRWVLEEATRTVSAWNAGRPWPALMSVNLSARQFAQPDAVNVVAEALSLSGAVPSTLCLEITESVVMEQSHTTIATLDAMKDLGVQLALDDFGTGYSSLGYLQRFRLDYLKIDRSFVDGLGRNEEQTAIVDAIVKMASALGLDVIAEGVETSEQVEILRGLGCDLVQGFLFARPEPATRAKGMIDLDLFALQR